MNNGAQMELQLAKNSDFQHNSQKIVGGKVKHCALCGIVQTRSEGSECQVPLCVYQGVHLSCFALWHTEKDLESSQETVLQSRTSQKNDEGEKVKKQRLLLGKNRKSSQLELSDSSQEGKRRKFRRQISRNQHTTTTSEV
jgi:hypothetical protein